MSERPILFSGPMVRALLAGRKTQTRRIVKPQPPTQAVCAGVISSSNPDANGVWVWLDSTDMLEASRAGDDFRCRYGVPGDRLWVRETWCPSDTNIRSATGQGAAYCADTPLGSVQKGMGWRPSIHMPRWASRLTLDITDVRVKRLQDISETDAAAEGTREPSLVPIIGACWSERDAYAKLWEHINGKGSWAANPWVWAVTFKVRQ